MGSDRMGLRYRSKRPPEASEHIEAQDVPKRKHSIRESDLFPFVVRPSVIADRDFVNDRLDLRHLGCDFNLNAKTAGLDDHVSDDVAAKRFVPGLDIRHVEVCQ